MDNPNALHSSAALIIAGPEPKSEQAGSSPEKEEPQTPVLAPLRVVDLPRVIPHHRFNLAAQGWTTITYDMPIDKLYTSAQAVLHASRAFFDLPADYKETFRTRLASEEGWSCIKGEKEFFTLRSLDCAPEILKDAASAFWAEAGCFLNDTLGCIAESLGLPSQALTIYSAPCTTLSHEKYSTMLRLFRYEGSHEGQSKIVAEAHKDLGLLSLVISDVAGLEVWSRHTQRWFPVEKSYQKPAGSLLVGRELEWLSNGRYRAGGHQVRSYSTAPIVSPQLDQNANVKTSQGSRYSAVFVLRAHWPVSVNTDDLTNTITGQFNSPVKGATARELFAQIRNSHFNINTTVQEREEQRQKLAKNKVAFFLQA